MKPSCLVRACVAAWGMTLGLAGVAAQAALPSVPQSDAEVIETLRDRPLSDAERAWRKLRAQARAHPGDVTLATQVAWQAVRWARQDGDVRWLGQAQAALAPWWAMAAPPYEVRLLRATILQSTHDFDAALKDLRALVQQQPMQAQAWLTLASVLQVTGRYEDVPAACAGVSSAGAKVPAQACEAEWMSMTGRSDEAQAILQGLASSVPRDMRAYLGVVQAELAERLGQAGRAEALYRTVLLTESDSYAEVAYADFLLDQGRATEVIERLQGRERNDALLLRLAEAYAMTRHSAADRAIQALRARFAAAHERGDSVHRREEARFTLRLLKQANRALVLALQNWQVQKEPADARILLEAARAAKRPDAALAAKAFMTKWAWRDVRLEVRP